MMRLDLRIFSSHCGFGKKMGLLKRLSKHFQLELQRTGKGLWNQFQTLVSLLCLTRAVLIVETDRVAKWE